MRLEEFQCSRSNTAQGEVTGWTTTAPRKRRKKDKLMSIDTILSLVLSQSMKFIQERKILATDIQP